MTKPEKFSIIFSGRAREILPQIHYLLVNQKNVKLIDIQRLSEVNKERK